MSTKWVYLFSEGNRDMRDLLGGKGAGVAEMTKAGMPVPPGFTITTAACNAYTAGGKKFPEGMWEQVVESMAAVEKLTGKKFGDAKNPLLVSVRSGAKFSMPGMMDTVLNLGLNEETLKGLVALSGDERFGFDAYRRFIQMFGRIVMGIEASKFEHILDAWKAKTKGGKDTDLTVDMLKEVVKEYKAVYKKETGHDFPTDPHEQLKYAIGAVFGSWMGRRAVDYRRINKIADDLGTAVNVQTMVFGNLGDRLRHRRCLHPQPRHRREGPLRRVPAERPGRRRRRRHSHPDEDRRDEDPLARRSTSNSKPSPAASRGTTRKCRTWSSPSSVASSICCRPAPASAPPPPPSRSPWTWWAKA